MKDKIDEYYQKYLNGILPSIFDQNSPRVTCNTCVLCGSNKSKDTLLNLYDDVNNFHEGFARVKKGDKYFFVNQKGVILKNPTTKGPMSFDYAGRFSEGLAWVIKDGKIHYIDKDGKFVIDATNFTIYNPVDRNDGYNPYYAPDFHCGLAMVKKDGKWNFIDKKGNLICDTGFDDALPYYNDFACVKKGKKWNFIDKKGKILSDVWFNEVCYFNKGLAKVKKGDKYNCIDTNGNLLSDTWFYHISDFHEGFASVIKYEDRFKHLSGNYWGEDLKFKYNFIDTNGKLINENSWYDYVDDFEEGFARVKKNGEYNFIDTNGKLLSDIWFRHAWSFQNGFALVSNSNYNFIDTKGEILCANGFDDAWLFSNGYAKVKRNNEGYNYIDTNGDFISNTWHFLASNFFHHGFGVARKYTSDYFSSYPYYVIDTNGKTKMCKVSSPFKVSSQLYDNYCVISDGQKYNILDMSHECLLLDEWINEKIEIDSLSFVKEFGCTLIKSSKIGFVINEYGNIISDVFKIKNDTEFINTCFCCNCDSYECFNFDFNGYSVNKSLFGYVCKKDGEKFRTKYQPIKIYDERYVLCYDKKNVFLIDRINNKVIEVRSADEIEYDNNFIFDCKNNKVLFIYHNEILDITDYYYNNLSGKEEIGINFDVKIKSKDDFVFEVEDEINEKLVKEREEQKKLQEAKREEEEKEKLEEAKINESKEQEKFAIKQKEAFEQLKNALEKLETLDTTNIPVKRIGVKNLFINVDNHREINPIYLSNGLLRYIDFSLQSFENVKMDGIDFSGCNIHFDPQKVYQRNLRNCNLKKVYISPFMNFADIDIRGASFSDDDDPKTVDGFNSSFRNAIYDETTTYNGKPFTEAFGECKNKPDIKVITKEE